MSIIRKMDIDIARSILPKRIIDSNKGTYGRVVLVGGCIEYSGAIRLAEMAFSALRSGVGLSTIACRKEIVDVVSNNILEATIFPLSSGMEEEKKLYNELDEIMKKADVIVCGMGLGISDFSEKVVKYIVKEYDKVLVCDADALNIISKDVKILDNKKAQMVFTPHLKEFERLYNASFNDNVDVEYINKSKIDVSIKFANKYKLILLLKGHETIITDGENVTINTFGTPGMATAGSGDVLSGILGGLVSYIKNIYDATSLSAYINGRAGEEAAKEYTDVSMVARDTISMIPKVIKELEYKYL